MAMACFRLVTRPPFPPRPLRNVPFLRRRIALSTRFDAAFPYRRPPDFFALLRFRFVAAISPTRIEVGVLSHPEARQEPRTTTRISMSFAAFIAAVSLHDRQNRPASATTRASNSGSLYRNVCIPSVAAGARF